VLYRQSTGGSTITVRNVEQGSVLGPGGVILFQW
jgi:hypothetical protein